MTVDGAPPPTCGVYLLRCNTSRVCLVSSALTLGIKYQTVASLQQLTANKQSQI